MDQKELQQKISESYSKLSPQAQKVFADMEWMNIINDLRIKHSLSEEQLGLLATETTLLLLGIIHIDEYESILKEKLGQTKEIADLIIKELHEKIINSIQSDLVKTHTENIELEKQSNPLDVHPVLTSLPIELQEAIKKSEYQKNLYAISTRHKLPVDKMAILEETTVRFMAGEMKPEEYEQKLLENIGGDKNDIKKIVEEVNNEVLLVIRNFLKGSDVEVNTENIPKPPYRPKELELEKKPISTIQAPLPKTQSGILATAGIEMMEESKPLTGNSEAISKKEDGVLSKSGIDVIDDNPRPTPHILPSDMTRKSTLEGVEHPPKITKNSVLEKLENPTVNTQSTTNYSIPKMTGDQYREPID